jgi:Protein of unknown function (DUF4256)
MKKNSKRTLTKSDSQELLSVLEARFTANMKRHKGLDWAKVEAKLLVSPEKLATLAQMEATSGEPDVVAYDKKTDNYMFVDCSAESPKGRRSCCYDEAARKARRENAPETSAEGVAAAMGAELLTEAGYRALQKLGEFDLKTSSWLKVPEAIRSLGGAVFGDRRYDQVFVYHNGADSYYSARGFRTILKV